MNVRSAFDNIEQIICRKFGKGRRSQYPNPENCKRGNSGAQRVLGRMALCWFSPTPPAKAFKVLWLSYPNPSIDYYLLASTRSLNIHLTGKLLSYTINIIGELAIISSYTKCYCCEL